MGSKDEPTPLEIRLGDKGLINGENLRRLTKEALEKSRAIKRSTSQFSTNPSNARDAKKMSQKIDNSRLPIRPKNSVASPATNKQSNSSGKIDPNRAIPSSIVENKPTAPRESISKIAPAAKNAGKAVVGAMSPHVAGAASSLLKSGVSKLPGGDAINGIGSTVGSILGSISNKGESEQNAQDSQNAQAQARSSSMADRASQKSALAAGINDAHMKNSLAQRVIGSQHLEQSNSDRLRNLSKALFDSQSENNTEASSRRTPLVPVISRTDATSNAENTRKKAEARMGAVQGAMASSAAASSAAAESDAANDQSQVSNALMMASQAQNNSRLQADAQQKATRNKDGDVFNRQHRGGKNGGGDDISGSGPDKEEEDEETEIKAGGKGKMIAGGMLVALLALIVGIGGVGTAGVGGTTAATAELADGYTEERCVTIDSNPEVNDDGGDADLNDAKLKIMKPLFNGEIKENAYAIIESTWEYSGVPQDKKARAAVIAIATASQESTLRNINYGDNAGPDSRGLFQQRDPWGSLADRLNPKRSTVFFLERLVKVKNWDTIQLTVAAQSVQISAHPTKYAQWEEFAKWALLQYRAEGNGVTSAASLGDIQIDPAAKVENIDWTPPPGDVVWNSGIVDDIRASYIRTRTLWPEIKSYGGRQKRSKSGSDHNTGKALDIMIPDWKETKGISIGNEVADFYVANAKKYGITYIIWRNKIWDKSWNAWKDYNGWSMYSLSELNPTTLHMDHVHISAKGTAGDYSLPDIERDSTNTIESGATPDQVKCEGDDALEGENDGELVVNPASGPWTAPLPKGRVTSPYGPRTCPGGVTCTKWVRFHFGLDISDGVGRGTGVGSPVQAPTKMKITAIRSSDPGYGTSLIARALDGTQYVMDFHHFAHGTIRVKVGDVVEPGTEIALAGTTGNSSGVHLHFQMMKDTSTDLKMVHSDTIDPTPILKAFNIMPPRA